ncbi:VWA domain-containing protein (plasmid) [Azospirillum oryzae]|uniref:VWA domain-containing protein n=1 Tax=Azospirillum oryzae TaxID=286727 RepID=A0A6N1B0A5_9PROT|nr:MULTISPECIES: VWA domain-containing protein [Azospirillum]KAA0584762.1 VWA domain-containing protein [Azospirillum oryzae]QCG99208.1 VWA domain-containing protein [Azospirillum sp. TSA2s]QKS54664.1 VWA domain-containing protein [Azospirillum oryzae]GLR77553.1 hypothetical protein GCM10007856_02210 [Azospirillum oryzae]
MTVNQTMQGTGLAAKPAKTSRKARTLYDSLPIVAAALGKKFGVQVIVSGNEMMTDGNRVYVPAFDPDEPDLCDLAYGVIAHEAGGHIQFTDWNVVHRAYYQPLRRELLNIIEDVRIEAALAVDYPGTRRTIAKVIDYLIRRGEMRAVNEKAHPADILSGYCLLRLRCDVLGQKALESFADESEAVAAQTFPAGAMVRLHALLSEVKNLESTADALDLVDLILTMLKQEEDKARQPPPQPPQQQQQDQQNQSVPQQQGGSGSDNEQDAQGDDDGSDADDATGGSGTSKDGTSEDDDATDDAGSDADGDGGGDDEGQGDSAKPGAASDSADGDQSGDGEGDDGGDSSGSGSDTDDSADDDQSGDGEGDDGGDSSGPNSAGSDAGDAGGSGSDQGGDYDPNGADAIAKALSASTDDVGSKDLFQKAAKDLSNSAAKAPVQSRVPAMAQPQEVQANPLIGQGIVSRVRGTSGRVRAQLLGLVQASQREDEITRRRGRAVNGRKITRILTGDTRVFTQRTDTRAPNAAIHILVDRSGSMAAQAAHVNGGASRNRLDVAIDSAVALATALEAIPGVNSAITAFPASRSDYDQDHQRAIGVLPLLKHGQKVRQVVGNFAVAPAGGTPLGEAMWYAAAQLVNTTKEERKLLLIVTDGEPNNSDQVIDMVRRCQASGIEVIGIGIQIDRVRQLFPTAVVIQDLTELRSALFEITRKALTAAAA